MGWFATGFLEALKFNQARVHQTLPDDISLSDPAIFAREFLAGAKQVTDTYLFGLAHIHGLRLVSFDRSLAWQAVRGATRSLSEVPTVC